MKKILFVLLLLISPSLFAQYVDASIFLKSTSSHRTVNAIPWITMEPTTNGVLFQVRYNFDAKDALTVFVGKNISLGKGVNLVPQLGYIYSEKYEAVTQELWTLISDDVISVFMLNQLSVGVSNKYSDFLYHWTEVLFPLNTYISIGFAEQVFTYLDVSGVYFDVGPTAKISIAQKFYLKPWITYDFTHNEQKVFLGIGYVF